MKMNCICCKINMALVAFWKAQGVAMREFGVILEPHH